MALIIEYEDPDLGFVDITDHVKWGQGQIRLTMTAEQGSVNTDRIVVEDPDGIFNFRGLRNFSVKETESEFERIYIGWTWLKHVSRGDYYRTGPGRVWEIELQDINHLLYQYVMSGHDTDRPAETDVERVEWLLTTNEATGITDTTTYVFTDRAVAMDANPDNGYNGQFFNQVIDDCAQQSGKNYFILDILDDYLGYKLGIWYGHDDLDEFVSEATISNVLAEVDNETVFWPDVVAQLDRDPSRVYSGVFGNFDGGWVYRSRPQTILDFVHRDTTANWPNVKTSAKAIARADRMLLDLAAEGEEDAVTVTIFSMLPSQANIFRAGHRVNGVKFTHFPGWETGRDARIVRKTIIDQSEQFYAMELDLLPLGPAAVAGSCSTAIVATESTGTVADTTTSGPTSVPVSAASFSDAMHVCFASYVGPLMGLGGCAPLVVGGSGWTLLDQESDNGASGWVAVGYNKVASGAPANMTVSNTCSGGGTATFFSETFAFPSSSTAPVQQSALTGSGNATLPGAPTPGNILFFWQISSISGQDTSQWLADGGTILVSPTSHNGGQWFLCIGIRCVTEDDTTTIRIPAGSHANVGGVSEWAP